jgi:hypothetical protein
VESVAMAVEERKGWPARQPSPKNSPASRSAITASFPSGRGNRELHGAPLKIHDRVTGFALGEDGLTLAIILDLSRDTSCEQIFPDVKWRFFLRLLLWP